MSVKPLAPAINWKHPLAKGLIYNNAFFELGGTKSLDLVNRRPGTWSGAGSHFGKDIIGTVGTFNGVDDQVLTTNNNSIKGLSRLTVAFLIYPQADNANGGEIYYEVINTSNTSTRMEVILNANGTINFDGRAPDNVAGGDATWVTSNTVLTLNKWWHVVCTWTTTIQKIYINGVLDATGTNTLAAFTNSNPNFPPVMGADNVGTTFSQQMFLADMKVYKRDLNAQEAKQLYTDPWQMYVRPLYQGFNSISSAVHFLPILGCGT